MMTALFPFAVASEEADERGADTMNRILLHGARYHQREAVFLQPGRQGWEATPDWRADRESLRLGLAFAERLGLGAGETVAIALELGPDWALVERAVWGLSGITLALDPRWSCETIASRLARAAPSVLLAPNWGWIERVERQASFPDSIRARVVAEGGEGSLAQLKELGGIRDTPELATRWRSAAGLTPAEAIATIDDEREWTHGALVAACSRVAKAFPARLGRKLALQARPPSLEARTILYSGWADGWTSVVLTQGESCPELDPELTVGSSGNESEEFISLSTIRELIEAD